MLSHRRAFSGFSSNDIPSCVTFYGTTLGLEVKDEGGMLWLEFGGGQNVLIYPKEDHQPASFTVLNFEVDDIEAAVDSLTSAGVAFERYPEFPGEQDGRGIARGAGPPIAWFTDPAGNILSIIEAQPAA